MEGWICPKCGRVYAPFVLECNNCNPGNVKTYTNGTNISGTPEHKNTETKETYVGDLPGWYSTGAK